MEQTRGVFEGIRQSVQGMVLPEAAFCPKCRYLRAGYDGLRELSESRGEAWVELASCRCPERDRGKAKEVADRLRGSNLPHAADPEKHKTFETFNAGRDGVVEAHNAAWAFAISDKAMKANILVLLGAVGTGKTHLVEAIGREIHRRGGTVRYEVVSELLDRLRNAFSDQSEDSIFTVMEWYQTRSALLLDDLGAEKPTAMAIERVSGLVDARYRNGERLVIATNLKDQDGMAAHLGDRLADRLWSKERDAVKRVYLTCQSYRTGLG